MNLSPFSFGRRSAAPLLAAGLLLASGCGDSDGSGGARATATYRVSRGPMRLTVAEAAELRATSETQIKSEVEGRKTINFLVGEGVTVETGQRIVELDVSELQEKRANQGIDVERARANLVSAQQDAGILEKDLAAQNAQALSNVEIAEIDVEKFVGRASAVDVAAQDRIEAGIELSVSEVEKGTNAGMLRQLQTQVDGTDYDELPTKAAELLGEEFLSHEVGEFGEQIQRQIVDIDLARQRLALAKDTLEHSVRLESKDYITRNQLESDRIDYESQKSQVKLAWQALDILISYTLRKTKIDLRLKLDNAKLNLDKVRATATASRERSLADLASREKEYQLALDRLERLDRHIAAGVIDAPHPGLVVYAFLDNRGREAVEEGREVRERQTILILPDVNTMSAEPKIQEADIDKVRAGQPAVVRIDALPDLVLKGHVERVSPLADSGSRWSNNNLKVYKTWVRIDGANDYGLRPNMSAQVEIHVGLVEDALTVPLTAVRRDGAVHYVWKVTSGGPVPMPVRVGQSTVTQVQVVEGLDEGEEVYLAPPAGVNEPDLPQPPAPEMEETPAEATEASDGAAAEESPAPSAEPVTRASFTSALLAEHPEFQKVIDEDGPMGMWRNEEVRAAIQASPKLSAMAEAMRAQMMQGGGRPGGPRAR